MPPIPLSQFEQIAALVSQRREAQERLDRYSRVAAFSVYFQENGSANEPVPERLLAPMRELLLADARASLAAIDDALRALGIDPEV